MGLAWQFAFLVIARDPVRFRLMMIPSVIEKFGYGASLLVLYFQQRIHPSDLVFAGVGYSARRAVSACLLSHFSLDISVRWIRIGDSMNRRSFLKWANLAGLAAGLPSASAFGVTAEDAKAGSHTDAPAATKSASPETILLKDYRPQSIYKIPVTEVAKAKFPIIDMHSHPYAKTAAEIDEWVRNMDEVGIEKTIILTMSTGAAFDEIQPKVCEVSRAL